MWTGELRVCGWGGGRWRAQLRNRDPPVSFPLPSLSLDYITLNLLGHTSYAVFNCSFRWSAAVKAEYGVCKGSRWLL